MNKKKSEIATSLSVDECIGIVGAVVSRYELPLYMSGGVIRLLEFTFVKVRENNNSWLTTKTHC